MTTFRQHFERTALISFEKREKLLRLAGEHVLDLDLDAGTARFGDRLALPFQVLGTESENTLTWLWAWADEQAEMPEHLQRSSREMKAWLGRNGLQALARPSLDLGTADGLQLACVAADVCGADALYRDPYEGGALVLLVFGREIAVQPRFSRAALARALDDLGSRYELDLMNALVSYARSAGLPCAVSGGTVNIELATGERVLAEFSGGRLARINTD